MVRPAPAASRATEILDFLIAHPTAGFTLSQIARARQMNVATARTVLAVLTEAGYVVRQPSNRTFGLGPLMVAAGQAALERYPAVDVARDEIRRLSRRFGVEFLLTVPAGNDIVAVARAGRPHPRGIDVGGRVPLVPPVGAVFAAWGSDPEILEWTERAALGHTTEAGHFRRILELTRSRGYSVALRPPSVGYLLEDLEVEGPHHVLMIAAPVFNAEGRSLLSISLLDLPEPLSSVEVVEWGERLRDIGLTVTRATRGVVPNDHSPLAASASRAEQG
jgi:DNA-binding IclR family transcriptional regulator